MRTGKKHKTIISQVLAEPWEYSDAETQYLTHNLHRYSGKFIPQIAARVINLLTESGDFVVDPYCGSGTTLLECARQKRRAMGVDLSPLATLIARTKTTPVDPTQLRKFIKQFTAELSNRSHDDELELFSTKKMGDGIFPEADPRHSDSWYCKWFQPQILRDLIVIDLLINQVPEEKFRNIARVAFSDILRRSSNAHAGYPNVMFDKTALRTIRPIKPFLKALSRVSEMVETLDANDPSWGEISVIQANATSIPVDNDSVDAVISHPPYIGSIPYAEYGLLSLKWLGADPKQLDSELTGGRRQSRDVVARFEDGYGKMLQESFRILRKGGYAFLMVGNPVVKSELIDLAQMTRSLASNAGLELIVSTERKGVNRRANKMGSEHLLFFVKP